MNYRDFFKEDIMPGGKGDNKSPKNVDPKELAMGIKVEMEHTKNAKLAKEIAMDHLTEDSHYYSKLKKAGLADELTEDLALGCGNDKDMGQGDKMAQAAGLASMDPQEPDDSSIVEPNTKSVDKQTVQGTVFEPVTADVGNGANMSGGIGSTNGISATDKTDVDVVPKDPQPTDHITGGMGSTPSNPNILTKQSGQLGGGAPIMQQMMKTLMPKDISIDIAEGKKILNKMMKEATLCPTTKGAATAFGTKKEGYGGTPGVDKAYGKNADGSSKRWTVKWEGKSEKAETDTQI